MSTIGVKLELSSAEFRQGMKEATSQVRLFDAELKGLDKGLTNTKTAFAKHIEKTDALKGKLSGLKEEQSLLTAKLEEAKAKFGENSTQANNYATKLEYVEQQIVATKNALDKQGGVLGAFGAQLDAVGDKLQVVGGKIKDVGTNLTTHLTIPIGMAFAGSAKAAIDWESAFTGVMKTVDETATTTYDDLKEGINKIAETTSSSQNAVAATMEIVGQLGVSADNAVEFTKVMVELGDTTNLSSEEAASSIAKFANVTGMALTDVDRLGAVIVDLGNNYATTEADIMSMATRLSGAGAQIGLSQGEILGLATALSSVGIEAEMGGSAFSKAMTKMQVAVETGFDRSREVMGMTGMSLRELELMANLDSKGFKELAGSLGFTTTEMKDAVKAGQQLDDFARVAGMDTEAFVDLYEQDVPAALQAFINGLGDTNGMGKSTIAMLQDMGFTEVRLRDTLTRLANANGLVTDAMAQGNEAWDENAALSNEAEKRYATMEAKLSQLKARLTEVAVEIGESLMPFIEKLMEVVDKLMDKWNSLDDNQKEMIVKIGLIVAAVGPLLVAIGSVISAVGTILSFLGTLSAILGIVGTAVAGLGAPFLVIVGIIAAVVAAGVLLYKNWDKIKETANKVATTVKSKWADLKAKTSETWDSIKTKTSETWDNIKTKTSTAADAMKSYLQNRLNDMKNAYDQHGGGLKGTVAAMWEGIKSYYRLGFNVLNTLTGGKLGEISSAFFNKFNELKNNALSWGRDIIQNIVNGINQKINDVKNAASNVAKAIKDRLHFSEPDKGPLKDFNTYMPDMMKQLASGMLNNLGVVENAANQVAGAINGPVQNSYNYGGISIVVNGTDGQTARELADIIEDRLQAKMASQKAVWA